MAVGEQITGATSGATAFVGTTTKGSPILDPFSLIANPGIETAAWYDYLGAAIDVDSGADPLHGQRQAVSGKHEQAFKDADTE